MRPALVLKPSGSRDASGQITPTAEGALRVVGDAWLIEEGTTNLIRNPLAANNLIDTLLTAGASRTRITTATDVAPTAVHVVADPAQKRSGVYWRNTVSVPSVSSLVASATIKGTGSIVLQGRSYISATIELSSAEDVIVLDGVARRYASGKITRNPADSFDGVGVIPLTTPANAGVWDISKVQIEAKDHATTFCPAFDSNGILRPGYAWSGTPHASSSTRTAASLAADLPSTWKSAYIRYHEGDGTPVNAVLTDEGQIGDYGILTVADDTATFTSNRALYLLAALAYDDVLTEGQIAKLDATPTAALGWSTLQSRQSGVLRIGGNGVQLPGIVRFG